MNTRTETGREVARWVISGIVILGVHGGVAAAIANWPQPAPAGFPEAAIMLDMSAEPAAPKTEKTDVAPDQVQQQQVEKQPEPVEKPGEKEPEPEVEPKKVDPPQKAEVELPQPKPVVKPPQKKMAALNTRPIAADKEAARVAMPSPGMLGQLKADYGVAISSHLNRYKNVPPGLQPPGGTVGLSFMLDRHGRVISSRIAHGSGVSELDREAMDMLRRAQPFPPPPADLAGSQFPFSVPVRYTVR